MRCALAIAAVVAFLAAGRASTAGELDVREDGGKLAIRAKDVPVREIFERLKGHVSLMYDADLETRVTLDLAGVTPAQAVERIAEAAGLIAVDAGDATPFFLVRRPRPPAAQPPPIEEKGGVFFAKDAFPYAVIVLRDRPEDAAEKDRLSRFELTKGISLLSAPDLEARVLREYLESRGVYRAIGERAGLPLALPQDVDTRRVRIYIDVEDQERGFAEVLIDAPGGVDAIHLVYDLRGKTMAVERLTIFRRPLRR